MQKATEVVNWSNVEEAAKLCANNHAQFESFGWTDRPENSELYMILNTSHRDSDLLTKSNESVMHEELLKFKTVWEESHSHWAVGYMDCLVIKVYRKDGKVTKAFQKLCELQQCLEDYPVLDEEDFSRREYEESIENITSEGNRFVSENAPDDWPYKVFSWLWDNKANACECQDGGGAYPSDDDLKEALHELFMLSPDHSLYTLEDFPVGTKVMVGLSEKSSNTLWAKPFSGYVVEQDEDNDMIMVQTDWGEKYSVMPGEVIDEWSVDNDSPNQHKLFYYFKSVGYVPYMEYQLMKSEAEELTHD